MINYQQRDGFFYIFFCTLGFFAGASTPCIFPRMIDGWLANVYSPVSTEKKINKLPGVSRTMYISILHMMHSISAVGVFVVLILNLHYFILSMAMSTVSACNHVSMCSQNKMFTCPIFTHLNVHVSKYPYMIPYLYSTY
jgi:hypothetical protein